MSVILTSLPLSMSYVKAITHYGIIGIFLGKKVKLFSKSRTPTDISQLMNVITFSWATITTIIIQYYSIHVS